MQRVGQLCSTLRSALCEVDRHVGSQAWTGPAAQRFTTEWAAQRAAIQRALDDAEAQAPQLIAAARRREAALRRQILP